MNLLNLFKPLADIIIRNEETAEDDNNQRDDSKAKIIIEQHKDIFCRLNPITWNRFQETISHKSQRYDSSMHDKSAAYYQDIQNVINALCHPQTVRSACDLYLQQIRDANEKQ